MRRWFIKGSDWQHMEAGHQPEHWQWETVYKSCISLILEDKHHHLIQSYKRERERAWERERDPLWFVLCITRLFNCFNFLISAGDHLQLSTVSPNLISIESFETSLLYCSLSLWPLWQRECKCSLISIFYLFKFLHFHKLNVTFSIWPSASSLIPVYSRFQLFL